MMRHYSVEYVDEEGDVVIKHVRMTQQEALSFIEEMAAGGVSVKMYDLTPPQVDEAAAVRLLDEPDHYSDSRPPAGRLEAPPVGRV